MEQKITLGCVADDFTGASDAASFIVKSGLNTVLFNGTPLNDVDVSGFDAVVIALKTRSDEKNRAVVDSLNAFKWLENKGATHFYSKYCSTFDSTREGNIGPILDSALEYFKEKYSVLCPALPVNKRIVKNGKLYVDGVLLNESHMKNHPLNPMWDADIAKLMEPQSKYPCFNIDFNLMKKTEGEIFEKIDSFGNGKEHFYIVPDYITDEDGEKIAGFFGGMKVLSGGSGLLYHIGNRYNKLNAKKSEAVSSSSKGKAILLAGSCSKATLGQIESFKAGGYPSFKINPKALLSGSQTMEDIWSFVEKAGDAMLLYSSDTADNVKEAQKAGDVSKILEKTMADLAKKAVDSGFKRIIVAGGETSGAVTKALGYDAYVIGESIAPGVPIMIPFGDRSMRVVLKSGNFGQIDFFERAVNITGK
ncbi:MAG: 3-oxo-tetronate kinase [Lachnospiraceae bacterium]|nr:3-oxo-tetronate kinase [Lachnospiraceae bacterium]